MTASHSLESLAEAVAGQVILDAIEASRRLSELGVPHALIGGLAVGLYARPRATKDADFLVGDAAFAQTEPMFVFREELRELVRVGEVDLMPLPQGHRELSIYLDLPTGAEIPVIGPAGLVLLKLLADRPQDRADIGALIQAGVSVRDVATFLRQHAPDLVSRFAEILAEVA
jgi:hypothetical protein